jgi:hypothetical protein
MRPYEYRATESAIPAQSLSYQVLGSVLERGIGLVVLSLLWGFILYLGLTAALS